MENNREMIRHKGHRKRAVGLLDKVQEGLETDEEYNPSVGRACSTMNDE